MTGTASSRWRGWAALVLLLLAAGGGFALLRDDDAGPDADAARAPADKAAVPAVPQPDPVLDRAALIDSAALAASAHAAGAALDDVRARLAGRRFRIDLPFGCAGPAAPGRSLANGWRVDDEGRTLRASVSRQNWTLQLAAAESAAMAAPQGERPRAPAEPAQAPDTASASASGTTPAPDPAAKPSNVAVTGFWIAHPWVRSAACPVSALPGMAARPPADSGADTAVDAAPAPTGERETLALVEASEPDARDSRPQQTYRADVRIAAGEAPVAGAGLRLRIDGRLSASGLPPVLCRSEGPGLRPVCFLVARFESVAVTSASGDRVFAEWRE